MQSFKVISLRVRDTSATATMATLNDSDVSLSDESLDICASGEEGDDESSSEEPVSILVPKMVGKHF